jgi:hypothetical protein
MLRGNVDGRVLLQIEIVVNVFLMRKKSRLGFLGWYLDFVWFIFGFLNWCGGGHLLQHFEYFRS